MESENSGNNKKILIFGLLFLFFAAILCVLLNLDWIKEEYSMYSVKKAYLAGQKLKRAADIPKYADLSSRDKSYKVNIVFTEKLKIDIPQSALNDIRYVSYKAYNKYNRLTSYLDDLPVGEDKLKTELFFVKYGSVKIQAFYTDSDKKLIALGESDIVVHEDRAFVFDIPAYQVTPKDELFVKAGRKHGTVKDPAFIFCELRLKKDDKLRFDVCDMVGVFYLTSYDYRSKFKFDGHVRALADPKIRGFAVKKRSRIPVRIYPNTIGFNMNIHGGELEGWLKESVIQD